MSITILAIAIAVLGMLFFLPSMAYLQLSEEYRPRVERVATVTFWLGLGLIVVAVVLLVIYLFVAAFTTPGC